MSCPQGVISLTVLKWIHHRSRADLKITIDGGLEITVPNHQLVQAYYLFNDGDGAMVVNDTVQELMINPLQAEV